MEKTSILLLTNLLSNFNDFFFLIYLCLFINPFIGRSFDLIDPSFSLCRYTAESTPPATENMESVSSLSFLKLIFIKV